MSNAVDLNASNFESTVADGVTLVDFWAEWCNPCKMMTPVIDKIASEYDGKARVGKIDVDSESDIAIKYEVNSIPTLIVFKDGEVSERFVGVTGEADLKKALEAACAA